MRRLFTLAYLVLLKAKVIHLPSSHLLPHRPASLLVNWHEAAPQLFVGAVVAGAQGVRLTDQSCFQASLALSLSLVNSEVMRRVDTHHKLNLCAGSRGLLS